MVALVTGYVLLLLLEIRPLYSNIHYFSASLPVAEKYQT